MSVIFHIKSKRFLPLPGEEEEIINEGMYGKALACFLQESLREKGYDAAFACAEDWGWWVELKGYPFTFGVCIYAQEKDTAEMEYAVTDGALSKRVWVWKRFQFIETGDAVEKLAADLEAIFRETEGVTLVGILDAMPDLGG